LIENPLYRWVRRTRWPMGRGRRQISELGDKGYWREEPALEAERELFPGACRSCTGCRARTCN
jgi:hypothetical protein